MSNYIQNHKQSNVFHHVYDQAIEQFSHYKNGNIHYLDNAATTKKTDGVIEAVTRNYRKFSAPVHRSSYPTGELASSAYDSARLSVAQFINAPQEQLVFTKSCTEAINQVALGWARKNIKSKQKIWISQMEHNANFLPWHQLCQETDSELHIIKMDDEGYLLLDQEEIWQENTFLIALTHSSNVLGGLTPIEKICRKAKENGIHTLVDASQSVSHTAIDVEKIGCDFLAFSAHKMYGPEGIGALYINSQRIPEMMPVLMGGGIVESILDNEIKYLPAPYCFEAGSPNLSGALGFAEAVSFLQGFPDSSIAHYIGNLGMEFRRALSELPYVTLMPIAGGQTHTAVISFLVKGVHPHDIAHMAGENDVAIRTGNHCSHLLLNHLNVGALNRVSLGVYNSSADIQPLIDSIHQSVKMFA